jgi:hypothetical protein
MPSRLPFGGLSRLFRLSALSLCLVAPLAHAVSKDLPIPAGEPSADDLAQQLYFVNHFYALKNYGIEKDGKTVTVIINRSEGKNPTTNTLERYLNNDYSDGTIKAKDLAIFRSGKLRGTGMLITDYVDDNKSQSYSIWLPALRKIRRFAEPAHDDAWGGSDFTFGDVYLRKPHHEDHEILGKATFEDCLGAMDIPEEQRNKYMQNLPEGACAAKGKELYKLKSTTKFENWWYDHRISYIDPKSFADYRTEYFKDGNKIKVIDRDWKQLAGHTDPRAISWGYWYGKTFSTGHETWAVIPDAIVTSNTDRKSRLWTEKTLRKIKR